MPAVWKRVRVFGTPIFHGVHAEPERSVIVVLPVLRERIEPFGLEFIEMDLRWSITREPHAYTSHSLRQRHSHAEHQVPMYLRIVFCIDIPVARP